MIDIISNNEGGLSIREKLNNVIESVNEFDNLFPVNLATDTTGFLSWSAIDSTPTTLSGYGITDAAQNITDPSVAYIRSDGSDTHGEIGNPHKPYLTLQEAYDDGARTFDIGVGTFAGLNVDNSSVSLKGRGETKTIITTIGVAQNATIEDASGHSFLVNTIQHISGALSGQTTLQSVWVVTINLNATDDHSAGVLYFQGNCFAGTININGKEANILPDDTFVYAKSGGSVYVNRGSLHTSIINANGGDGYSDGASNHIGPAGGGDIILQKSTVENYIFGNGGTDPTSGSAAAGANITVANSYITIVFGDNLTITGYSSTIQNVFGSTPNIQNFASYLGGH